MDGKNYDNIEEIPKEIELRGDKKIKLINKLNNEKFGVFTSIKFNKLHI